MHRALRSLAVSIAALSARDLKEAANQETDIDVLMEALRRALAKNANHAALSQLQLTTRMQALLKVEGGSIKVGEVQKILGISRQAIARRREQGKLLALPLSRTFLFPAWQFSAKGMWPGMEGEKGDRFIFPPSPVFPALEMLPAFFFSSRFRPQDPILRRRVYP